jgi:hypothetical protein
MTLRWERKKKLASKTKCNKKLSIILDGKLFAEKPGEVHIMRRRQCYKNCRTWEYRVKLKEVNMPLCGSRSSFSGECSVLDDTQRNYRNNRFNKQIEDWSEFQKTPRSTGAAQKILMSVISV